ncbi:MAG: sugar phosphate isomerase/epimerase [Planctomycetota bacterium]
MADMTVALQVYTIREHLQTLDGFAESMEAVREIGYEHVELAGVGPIDLEDQRKVCDDNGLTVIASHTPYPEFRDAIDAVIEKHKLLGAEFAVLPSLPADFRNADGYERMAEEASGFAETLDEAGLGFAYHNHDFEFEKYGDRLGLEILFDESDERVGSELDLYWVQHGGASPVAWIRRLRGRLPLLHLKDFEIRDGEQLFAEVGEGNLEWDQIFDTARGAGTAYLAVEEDRCTRPSMESVELSFRNLRAMGLC